MERAAVMAASLDAGRPVDSRRSRPWRTACRAGSARERDHVPDRAALVDEVVLLTEQEIWDGMRFAFDQHRLVLEGGPRSGSPRCWRATSMSLRDEDR
jgi:threonine dehydratase